jgi:methyltransferase (TIGR00027 family)
VKDSTPSATAIVVAKNVALVAATPRLAPLVGAEASDLTALLIRAYSRRGDSFLRRARAGWFRCLFGFYERLTIPGLALHQALRKRHIERVVRSGLAEGFEQVVILGGGLDTLALRLHGDFPGVNFLELDHPATQRLKRDVVEGRRLAGPNLKLTPVDFGRQSLQDFLAASPDYLPGKRTVFLSEGVLMYLAPDEIDSLFDVIRRQAGARFVFTFMEPDVRGRPAFRNSTWLVRFWLRLKGEPFRWGLSRAEVPSFLAARGFSLKELVTEETMRRVRPDDDGLRLEAVAEGEILCVADRGE